MQRIIAHAVLGLAALMALDETFRAEPNGYVFLVAVLILTVAIVWVSDLRAEERR